MRTALIIILLPALVACVKRNKDVVTPETISGMVYNQCTDSGLANVPVYLKVIRKNSTEENYETVSGAGGLFTFNNIGIHSLDEYSYAIHIPTKSGIGGGEVGLNGTTLFFYRDEIRTVFKPRVVPKYRFFCIDFAGNPTLAGGDSISVYYEQQTFHKNVPDLPYKDLIGAYGVRDPGCSANYPMGLWRITVDKWKNGTHTTLNDNVYLGWGDTKTYYINW